jgi:hypothetical protein
MKKLLLAACLYLCVLPGHSQNQITRYEYWFDNVFATKKQNTLTPGTLSDVTASIPTSGLPAGIHTIQTRFQDSNGKWTVPASSFFVKMPVSNGIATTVTACEYWFDNDYTSKKSQSISSGSQVSVIADISAKNLPAGIHTLQVRFKDSNGKWTVPTSSFFVKMPVSNGIATTVTACEYWFDNDYSGKKSQSISLGSQVSVIADISAKNLPAGIHTFQVRFQDNNGKWTVPTAHIFLNPEPVQQAPANITRYRYWFNNDFANRTDITVDPVNPLQLTNLNIPVVLTNKIMPDNYHLQIDSVQGNKIVYHPYQLFNIQFKDSRHRWSSTSIDTVRYDYKVDLKCDTLVSKVAKNVQTPQKDTLHVYKTYALAGDSLYFYIREMMFMGYKFKVDIFDPNGVKLNSVSNSIIRTGVRVKTDGLYYIAIHGFKSGFQYTVNYTRIDRLLPNLHVSSVNAQDAIANTKTTIKWIVKNDGTASTGSSTWRDRIWLVKDITRDFSSTGVLLHDVQNKKSLTVGESYQDSAEVTIPERYESTYYVVVMSDMNGVTSINWAPAGGTVPSVYSPSTIGTPYPYLNATFTATNNKLLELNEKTNLSDNFFYKAINITLPPLADLQISALSVPATIIAERKSTISATITNKGNVDVAANKSFVNKLYWSKDAIFNKNTAGLLTSQTLSGGLLKDATKNIQFTFTAPSDSVNQIRFFVETDALDSIFELDQTNNIANGNWLKLKANTIQTADYAILKSFYASAAGSQWTTKWNTASNVINATNWYGVSFNEGYVTSIALPSNNITTTFPVILAGLDSLTTLQLAGNKLYGQIPTLTNQFKSLKTLDLSNNKFSSMTNAIPFSVSNLNLSYQQFSIDSVQLSVNPAITFPQLLTYNHAAQVFNTKPAFVIYDGYNHIGSISYNTNNEQELSWYNANGWNYKSGKVFTLSQNNGTTYGSNAAMKIYYDYGDANVDKQLSVLDVQHTLNNILGEPATPFNFAAADTYCDTLITVQDIVKTVDILLNEVAPIGPPENIIRRMKATEFPAASIYVADNKLMLENTVPVAAIDITLRGLTESQLQHQLADFGYSVITRRQQDGSIRFIAFSVTGSEIPVGKNSIALLNSETAQLKQVVLSNKQAKMIAVEISEYEQTDVLNNKAESITVSSNQAKVFLQVPSGFETVDVVVYNPQGVELTQRSLQSPAGGNYQFDFTNDIRMQGIYFIKVIAKSNNSTSSLNSKIIVSK